MTPRPRTELAAIIRLPYFLTNFLPLFVSNDDSNRNFIYRKYVSNSKAMVAVDKQEFAVAPNSYCYVRLRSIERTTQGDRFDALPVEVRL